jgi:hypothetical protein
VLPASIVVHNTPEIRSFLKFILFLPKDCLFLNKFT